MGNRANSNQNSFKNNKEDKKYDKNARNNNQNGNQNRNNQGKKPFKNRYTFTTFEFPLLLFLRDRPYIKYDVFLLFISLCAF